MFLAESKVGGKSLGKTAKKPIVYYCKSDQDQLQECCTDYFSFWACLVVECNASVLEIHDLSSRTSGSLHKGIVDLAGVYSYLDRLFI